MEPVKTIIRDAHPEDAPFLARCIMAGMHFYDFETEIPAQREIYAGLVESEGRGIGRALIADGILKGTDLGYGKISLIADSDMPHLMRLYESLGFREDGYRHAYGVDFLRMVYTV